MGENLPARYCHGQLPSDQRHHRVKNIYLQMWQPRPLSCCAGRVRQKCWRAGTCHPSPSRAMGPTAFRIMFRVGKCDYCSVNICVESHVSGGQHRNIVRGQMMAIVAPFTPCPQTQREHREHAMMCCLLVSAPWGGRKETRQFAGHCIRAGQPQDRLSVRGESAGVSQSAPQCIWMRPMAKPGLPQKYILLIRNDSAWGV
jgi:hypothetical protein